ncbi:Rrf2 family transcriptional regulator, partial [Coprococcus eutactus]|uniref:Rrf2 family transcriptional regulator n=1 Tax=Coprococcus eutactus TaxID=33043 RepID=UPI00210A3BA2
MVIYSKGEYALRVMADHAINHDGRFIPLKEIVQKEELSQKYLESILRMLSKANL